MALSIVYPPKGSTIASTVDIVAVHGLGGDAINTWTHPSSKAFWLKDFLPQQIPDARILTFGYNAAAAFGQSTSEVIDHAKGLLSSLVDKREEAEEKDRPLIFVAHSLGGIVVKQALLQARLEPRYQSICNATLGIMFFGTPHRGSEKATYGKVLAGVAQTLSRRPPPHLLTALKTNSDVLLRLTSDFRFQLPQYNVVSFFEQRPMSVFSSLIVEKHSALLEVEHEEQIPVDANHSAMCKFETENDDTFEKAYKRIRRMRDVPPSVVKDQAKLCNKFFEVPHLLSPMFTGQDDVCQQLDKSLILACNDALISHQPIQRRFVLFGLGGSGKTQICVRYAQLHRERYWGIFWVDSSTHDNIQRSMKQIALLLRVEQDLDSVKRALANASHLWLLIFDNADDPRLPLTPYFPRGDRGHIIVTSRNPASCHYSSVGYKELAKMSQRDAETLLLRTVSGDLDVDQETDKSSQKVVSALGYLALAVTQAGAYIRETSCTFDDYLDLYHRRQKDLLTFIPQHSATDYHNSVHTTWQVSVDMIESMHDTASISAMHMLRLLGFYHCDQIPLTMLYNAWINSKSDVDEDWLPWPHTISDFFDLQQFVHASASLLASFSLLKKDSNASLSIHPLVHEWCRQRMSAIEQESASRHATTLLARSINWRFDTNDYTYRRSLLAHIHALLRDSKLETYIVDVTTIDEWQKMELVLQENGSTRDAVRIMEQIIQIQKEKFGEEHPNTLGSIQDLATRYSEAGRQDEALQLTEQVLQLRKNKLGEEHPDTLASMSNLVNRYSEAGRRDEALQLCEPVVQLRKNKLGEEHPNTLASMHNLAILYSEVGRGDEALQLIEQVVAIRMIKLGEKHPETVLSTHNLAILYGEVGREDEALQLAEQVVSIRKIKLGEEHPDTLASMCNLANRYSKIGRGDEALQLIEHVVQLQKIKLGDEHPDTLRSMNNLTVYYAKAGRRDEALLQLAEHVVQIQKSKLGEEHPDTTISRRLLARLQQERKITSEVPSRELTTPQPKGKRFWRLLRS